MYLPPRPSPGWHACLLTGLACGLLSSLPLHAQTAAEASIAPVSAASSPLPASTEPASAKATLPEITVRGSRPAVVLIDDRPSTTINATELQRRQSDNIFDVLKDVPGVSVAGGPRASGMKFNLRGFSDNEDVLFKIDGAVKGFEKYRFGGGVFIEPELLKAIKVERGPSVTAGSGALGGSMSATTKSASDFLRPGEHIGALTKVGYGWNNQERLRMVSVFGRPTEQIDLLASVSKRESGDVRQPNGKRVEVSATNADSSLIKIGVTPIRSLNLELSRVAYTSGPERAPYDATHGSPGIGGIVKRSIDDETVNLRFTYSPANPLIKLRGTLAKESTDLHDEHSITPAGTQPICRLNPPITNTCGDDWHYDIVTSELFNDSRYQWDTPWGAVQGLLTLGFQEIRNQRDIKRTLDHDPLNAYPGGFNSAQPPGGKHSRAFIVENTWTWKDLSLTPGARWDRYTVTAEGGTRLNMERAGQAPSISFSKVSPAAAVTWRPGASDWALTYRYNETFRPPLIDEYFAEGGFGSRCGRSVINPFTGLPYTALPLYDTSTNTDLAPTTGICGALYKPQEAVNREVTLAWNPSEGLAAGWSARLTMFRMRVDQLLDSLRAVNGAVVQTGMETRRGTEFEAAYQGSAWFSNLSHSRTVGQAMDTTTPQRQLTVYGIPGPTTVFSVGGRWFDGRVEAGWRWRSIGDRQALAGAATVCNSQGVLTATGDTVGTQHGVRLNDLFASWQVSDRAQLRASVDNVTNETYCLNDAFAGAVGAVAPGRAARVSVSLQF